MLKTGVAYHDVRNVRHAREDLQDMLAHHCNFVVHTLSETDLSFYMQTMKEIVRISKDLGMETYIDPWGVGRIFGGEALSAFVGNTIDARQILANDKSVPAACMNSPEFRSFMRLWTEAAADTGADVAFWDEPHFYTGDWVGGQRSWACRCPACQKIFKDKYGRPMPREMDGDVVRFREQTVVDFFKELCDHARACGMKNALCVLPEQDAAHGTTGWEALAAIPSLDIFGTDPYWAINGKPLESYCREKTREAKTLCEKYGRELQMWVQAFLIQEGKEDEVMQAAEFLYDEGARNIAAWSYGGGGWMIVRSDNADKVWSNLGKVFEKLHKTE
jgi:sugar phosphate isomerase/epimerase